MQVLDKRLFEYVLNNGGSDLHLCTGSVPMIRKDGKLKPIPGYSAITLDQMKQFLKSHFSTRINEQFKRKKEHDFQFELKGRARFRVNAFFQRKGPGIVFRVIPTKPKSLQELGLPYVLQELCHREKGLILVTGPTGSGKTTTLAAMVDYINSTHRKHILTIEDPIEFVFENKRCLINQREVGFHTDSFSNALRGALREDPDIILVGEMRDLETISLALTAAETGHLVLGTLHTNSAAKTVDRIVSIFPANEQEQIRTMLAASLVAVIAQDLIPKKGGGRLAIHEILIASAAVKSNIRENKLHLLASAMEASRKKGMITFSQSLEKAFKEGLISEEVYEDKKSSLGLDQN